MPPAARITDMHTCPMVTGIVPHVGGPILPPGAPTVLIGFLPAATVTTMATCVGPPDIIVKGSAGVMINFMPAARIGDTTAHGGVIIMGCPTVIIGEVGSPSPGAAGMGAVTAGLAASGPSDSQKANASILGKGATYKAPDATVLANTEVNGLKPVRVLPGTNGKVAVMGRSMNDAVNPCADSLKAQGYDVETFSGNQIPEAANQEWSQLRAQNAPNYIPEDQVVKSQLFKANEAWAEKLKAQGYTVVDMGNPTGAGPSPFYDMEQTTLFGKAN